MLEPKLYEYFDALIFNIDRASLFAFELTESCKKTLKKRKMTKNTDDIEILEELLYSFNKISDKLSELYDDTELIKLPEEDEEEKFDKATSNNNILYFDKSKKKS